MALITTDDFTGPFTISIDLLTENQIQQYIDLYTKQYLEELLGCELYALFIADLDISGVPQTQRFIDIYNSICEDTGCGINRSFGMKDMITGFIYFEWIREQKFKKTATGTVVGDSENSNEARFSAFNLYQIYNRSVKSYQAIQYYICENSSVYPEYEGVPKQFISWI